MNVVLRNLPLCGSYLSPFYFQPGCSSPRWCLEMGQQGLVCHNLEIAASINTGTQDAKFPIVLSVAPSEMPLAHLWESFFFPGDLIVYLLFGFVFYLSFSFPIPLCHSFSPKCLLFVFTCLVSLYCQFL